MTINSLPLQRGQRFRKYLESQILALRNASVWLLPCCLFLYLLEGFSPRTLAFVFSTLCAFAVAAVVMILNIYSVFRIDPIALDEIDQWIKTPKRKDVSTVRVFANSAKPMTSEEEFIYCVNGLSKRIGKPNRLESTKAHWVVAGDSYYTLQLDPHGVCLRSVVNC